MSEYVKSLTAGNKKRPDVTIIVVSYNTAPLLERMFDAIERARGNLAVQIIVIDNASRDGSAELLRGHSGIELIENKTNVGFGRANNQALWAARGHYVLLLNTDAFVAPDTLQKTVDFMESNPRCGVLGVKLVSTDGTLQPSCRYFPTPWNEFSASNRLAMWLNRRFFPSARLVDDMTWSHAAVRECDWVPGCYYLIRSEVVKQVGLFDPRFFLYYEEVDHCRRVRQAGWNVVFYPHTEVVHIGGESAASASALTASRQISELQIESELLYFRKHYGIAGVLSSVLLRTLGNVISACSGLVRDWDAARAERATQYVWTQFRLLSATRLGTRSTR